MTKSSPDRQDPLARAPHPSGPAVRQRSPMAIRWAAGLMFAGAAFTAAGEAAQIALVNTVTWTGNGGGFFAETGVIFIGIPATALECGLWLWMGWMALAGRGWARIMSSVLFGVQCWLFIDSFRQFSSNFGVPNAGPFYGSILISAALGWLAGLAALILLWQRASSQFYAASRQARALSRQPRQ